MADDTKKSDLPPDDATAVLGRAPAGVAGSTAPSGSRTLFMAGAVPPPAQPATQPQRRSRR